MDKAANKAIELLQQVAEKLGKTINQLYPYFVRQVYIEAWAALVVWVIITGLLFGGGLLLFKNGKRNPQPTDEVPNVRLGAALMLIAVVAAVVAVAYNMTQLLNPDYHAITTILRLATGK